MALEGNDHVEILRRLREYSVPLSYQQWATMCKGIPGGRRAAPHRYYMNLHFGPDWKTQLKTVQHGASPGRPATDPGTGPNVDGFDPGSLLAGRPDTGTLVAHGTPAAFAPAPPNASTSALTNVEAASDGASAMGERVPRE